MVQKITSSLPFLIEYRLLTQGMRGLGLTFIVTIFLQGKQKIRHFALFEILALSERTNEFS